MQGVVAQQRFFVAVRPGAVADALNCEAEGRVQGAAVTTCMYDRI